jgi:gas vesicle protein
MASKDTTKKWVVGAAAAAAAGYIAGILTAPKSGKETRQDIKDAARKIVTELGDLIDKAKKELSDLTGKAKEELSSAVDKASSAKEKAQSVLSAVKAGKAEDKDLQKAVEDATKAVNHLKSFLKKA